VLKNGHVAVMGAEDNFSPPYYSSVSAIYNPWDDTWTQVLPPNFGDTCAQDGTPGGGTYWCAIGETGSVVLNDGSLMVGNSDYTSGGNLSKLEALLPPPYRGPWIQTGSGKNDGNTEQGYTLLPSLDPKLSVVMTVDTYHGFGRYGTLPTPICAGVPAGSPGWQSSEIYYKGQIGTTVFPGVWSCLGDTQVQLWAADDSGPPGTRLSYDEMGPAVLRPDGTVIQFGANVNSATAILGTDLTWTAGPYIPTDINCTSNCPPLTLEDGPAALLPDGNVLMMASPERDTPPVAFFELTYGTNTLVQVPGPSMSYDNSMASSDASMLVLPNGNIMLTTNRGYGYGNGTIWIYQPTDGTYDLSWAPEICGGSCSSGNPTQIYNNLPNEISGLRFNGMSQGAAFGDEFQDATNYPLVRITDSNNEVYYCQTYDFSSMGVQTGNLTVATLYSCPNVPTGTTGNLEVVANGIPSNPMAVTVVKGCTYPYVCPPNPIE
jgi:hypothetical protein